MGLGLSIVRESMEAMGGIVSVESVEGEGTTFARVAGHLTTAEHSYQDLLTLRPALPVIVAGRLPGRRVSLPSLRIIPTGGRRGALPRWAIRPPPE